MRTTFLLYSMTLLLLGCSDSGHVIYRDEEAIKKAQSRPTKFKDLKCQPENVVGKWYYLPKGSEAKTSSCIWIFSTDGSIHSEGSSCAPVPERYKIERAYSKELNAFLDIKLSYQNKKMEIVADCVTDGKTMKFDEGSWTFHKAR